MKHDDLVAYNRRWVELHKGNPHQREAAERITVLCNALERPTITDLDKAGYAVVRHGDAVREYRAVFSFPESYGFSGELEAEPDSYSRPTRDRAKVPTHAPRSEETHGWVSGVQSRLVSAWGNEEGEDE